MMKRLILAVAMTHLIFLAACAQSDSTAPQPSASGARGATTDTPAQPAEQAAAPAAEPSPSETVESVQEKILALRGRIKSFTATIDVKFDSSQNDAWVKSHTYGPMAYQFDGDKVLYRIDMTVETKRIGGGEDEETTETQTLMSDGEYMYQFGTQAGKKKAYKARIDKLQSSVPSPEFFFFLRRDYALSVLPDEQVDGKDCWVIRAAKISEEEVLQLKTLTFFRKDIPLMVKTVNLDRFDNVMQVTKISDIQVDVPVDPKQFEFRPDPDCEVQDQTGW
jgi:outer membrane lipoprotein-sorting protein